MIVTCHIVAIKVGMTACQVRPKYLKSWYSQFLCLAFIIKVDSMDSKLAGSLIGSLGRYQSNRMPLPLSGQTGRNRLQLDSKTKRFLCCPLVEVL